MPNFDEQWLADYRARGRLSASAVEIKQPKQLRRSSQHEWTAQEADAEFLALALPLDAFWTAIDSGKADSAKAGALRKKRGIKAGVPDFIVVWNKITLWIERKAGARLSIPQANVRAMLLNNGHHWVLAHSTEDIERALIGYGIPLRVRLDVRSAASG